MASWQDFRLVTQRSQVRFPVWINFSLLFSLLNFYNGFKQRIPFRACHYKDGGLRRLLRKTEHCGAGRGSNPGGFVRWGLIPWLGMARCPPLILTASTLHGTMLYILQSMRKPMTKSVCRPCGAPLNEPLQSS